MSSHKRKATPLKMLYPSSSGVTSSETKSAATAGDEKSESNNTRDKDLLSTDQYLTDDALDDLWNWFCAANVNNVDPQLVFVKMVNAARKPYIGYIISKNESTPDNPQSSIISGEPQSSGQVAVNQDTFAGDDDGNPNLDFGSPQEPSATSTADCSSQSSVAEHQDSDFHCQENDDVCISILHIVNDFKDNIKTLTKQVDSTINSAWTPWTFRAPLDSIRVTIKADYGWRDSNYLTMDGSGVTENNSRGGKVQVRAITDQLSEELYDNEIFELVPDPELGSKSVSFKSTCVDNVYLYAGYQYVLDAGHFTRMGVVNCEYGISPMTMFQLLKTRRGVSIIPVEYPETKLCVDKGNNLTLRHQSFDMREGETDIFFINFHSMKLFF